MSNDMELPEDEAVAAEGNKKKRGRPKNQNYLSWDEARAHMRGEMIPSRGKFFEWWDRNKPKTIPRFPYRVYQDEWTSWNDFLGTNNKFNEKVGTKWRPFLEAVSWAMKRGLKTQNEWMEFCKQDGLLPDDIPARPDLVYDEWRSWAHWLGNRPVEAVQAQQEIIKKTHIFYVIRTPDAPQNVLTFGVDPNGLTAFKHRWEDEKFEIVRLYWYDPDKRPQVDRIIAGLSTSMYDDETRRIVPNVWELLYYLSMELQQITPKDVA